MIPGICDCDFPVAIKVESIWRIIALFLKENNALQSIFDKCSIYLIHVSDYVITLGLNEVKVFLFGC